jgi:hypothetical protein
VRIKQQEDQTRSLTAELSKKHEELNVIAQKLTAAEARVTELTVELEAKKMEASKAAELGRVLKEKEGELKRLGERQQIYEEESKKGAAREAELLRMIESPDLAAAQQQLTRATEERDELRERLDIVEAQMAGLAKDLDPTVAKEIKDIMELAAEKGRLHFEIKAARKARVSPIKPADVASPARAATAAFSSPSQPQTRPQQRPSQIPPPKAKMPLHLTQQLSAILGSPRTTGSTPQKAPKTPRHATIVDKENLAIGETPSM